MAHLFVDTSHLLHFGILDDNYKWIDNKVLETKKTSEVLHEEILNMLTHNNLEIDSVKSLITIAGPGSYTGMRVGEGFAQIFELNQIEVYSFYSSDIPGILGEETYYWMFPAFKKEYYIRTSDGEKLLNESDFQAFCSDIVDKSQLYTHGINELSEKCDRNTRDLLISSPESIFKAVVTKKLRQKPYYFRPLDVEFKKS